MKNAKLILIALAILLAAIAVWVVVGFVVTIVKLLFVLAVIVFGISIFRKLFGKSETGQLGEPADHLPCRFRPLQTLRAGPRRPL